MNWSILLMADIDTMFKIIVFFIVVGSWILRTLFGDKKKVADPRRPARAAAAEPPPKVRPSGGDNLNQEIEDFLKRAAQRRGSKTRREPTPIPVAEKKPVRRLVETSAQPVIRTTPLGQGVSEHVEQHLANQEFTVRAAHLADDVVRSEQEMQQHLSQAFSHQVGRLADTSTQGAADKAALAAAVAKQAEVPVVTSLALLLADGTRLRQAIILNEIFERPEHRW